MPNGYTRTQIILHWLIFALIAAQFIFHDGISEAFRSLVRTGEFDRSLLAVQHVFTGIAILLLVVWRFSIKARRGAPALPDEEPKLLKLTAHLTHIVLYLLMVLVPVSGLIAWFLASQSAGEVHEIAKSVLLVLVGLHFAGALFQKFVLKSNVMERMVRPNP